MDEKSKEEFDNYVRKLQLFIPPGTGKDSRTVREYVIPDIMRRVFELGFKEGKRRIGDVDLQ